MGGKWPFTVDYNFLCSSLFCFVLHECIVLLFFSFSQKGDVSLKINEKGCLQAGDEWLTKNLIPIAGVAVGIAFLQVCQF